MTSHIFVGQEFKQNSSVGSLYMALLDSVVTIWWCHEAEPAVTKQLHSLSSYDLKPGHSKTSLSLSNLWSRIVSFLRGGWKLWETVVKAFILLKGSPEQAPGHFHCTQGVKRSWASPGSREGETCNTSVEQEWGGVCCHFKPALLRQKNILLN